MRTSVLSAERLRELFHYNPEVGVFIWRVDGGRWGRIKAGTIAGCTDGSGYRVIGVDGRLYRAHRLAWLYVHGQWPVYDIDHRNGDKSDNRLDNLRDATKFLNMQNLRRAKVSNKSSGLLGVSKNGKNWMAHIVAHGKAKYLGTHPTPKLAQEAYLAAKRIHHPGCEA